MTNKQSTQHQDQSQEVNPLLGEKIGGNLLLRGWNMALQVVNEAVQHNVKSGVKYPERFTSAFFDNMLPMDVKKKQNFIAACINVKSGTPYTLDLLENAQVISPEERPLFGELPLPRREIVSLHRIQAPNKMEYLSRVEQWLGLNRSAGIVTISYTDIDFTRRITIDRQYVHSCKSRRRAGSHQNSRRLKSMADG